MKNPSDPGFAFPPPPRRTPNHQRKRPVQGRAQATVEAILKGTFQVLDEVGLKKLTTTRVAKRAGVSVGTLYQYYPDKAALVTALKAADGQEIVDAITAVLSAQRDRPIPELMRAVIAAVLAIKHKKRAYVFTLNDADRAAIAQIVDVLAPLVPVRHAATRTALLVAALDGPIVHAAKHRPALLKSEAFLDELCALSLGYLEQCVREDARRSVEKQER